MRETEFYGQINGLKQTLQQVIQFVNNLQNSVRLAFTGETVRSESLQSLLIKKGIITVEEMTAEVGETLKKMQAEAEAQAKANADAALAAAAKTEIIKPTTAEVQAVANTPIDAPVVTPPQA